VGHWLFSEKRDLLVRKGAYKSGWIGLRSVPRTVEEGFWVARVYFRKVEQHGHFVWLTIIYGPYTCSGTKV